MLGERPISVIRQGAGSYVDGYWVPGADTTLSIRGSAQPLTAKETMLLSEGDREREWIKVYTKTELKAQRNESGALLPADRLTVDGRTYVVMKVWPYQLATGMRLRHYKIEACLENENTNDKPPAEV